MKKILFFWSVFFHILKAQGGYYYVKTFQTELHKEANAIGKLAVEPNGIVFCSHSQGILTFDGKKWYNLPVESAVYDIKIIQNQIFFITDKYLGKISLIEQPYKIEKFIELQSQFRQIENDSQNLYLYSEEEILVLSLESKIQKSIKSPSEGFFGGMLKYKNAIWVLDPGLGFLSIQSKNYELEPVQNSQVLENQYLQNYFVTPEALYLVTLDNAIYVYENENFKFLGQYNSGKNTYIHGIIVIEDEIIAATNNQGLLVINRKSGAIQQQITTIHGLPDNESYSLFLDNHQGIWLAHPFHFSRIYWSKKLEDYTNAVGIIGNIHVLAQNQEQLWVGTDNGLFYLSYEIPKESEMVSFTVSKTIVKKNSIVRNIQENPSTNSDQQEQESKTQNENKKEKKGFLNKLKEKLSKKDKNKSKQDNNSNENIKKEQTHTSTQEKKQTFIEEKKYTYQENVNQISIKSAENYRRYLVFRPVQGISEIVYDIKVLGNRILVGTQKGFYEIIDRKIEFKLPVLAYKIVEKNGNIWVASNQKVLELQKNGKSWQISKTLNTGRFINSLVIRNNEILGGTIKGYFKTSYSLQSPQWFLEKEGNTYLKQYQNQVLAISSTNIYKIENEPSATQLKLPSSFQIIPSQEGVFLFSKSLIFSLNEKLLWDTLYYSRLLDDVPSYIYQNKEQYWLSGKKSLFKFYKYKETFQSPMQVYTRGYFVTGKSFWSTVYKDSLIYDNPLNLSYGDYNIEVMLSTSHLFNPEVTQYFVSINNGEWTLVDEKNWVLYNLPSGKYSIALKAVLPNGETSEVYAFAIYIASPFWRTWWFYLLMVSLFIGSAYLYTKYKLRKLEEEKRKIEEQNKILEQKVEERTREIAEQKQIIEEKNAEIMDSLRYSERIQQAMLPKEQQISTIFENNCFVLYMPRDVVSGDFYWVYEKNDQLLIAAGDCTGHGVPGALMSMIGISMLNKIVDMGIYEPAKILSLLHKEVHESLKQNSDNQVLDGMDIALVLYEPHKSKLTLASAMRPVYLIRDHEIIIYKGDKKPIGGREPEKFFSTHEMFLEDGDIFYLFSDGYADQFNENNQKYQLGRFRKKLLEIHQEPLKKQQEILKEEILQWKGNAEQVDDIMVIGIKYKK
ncbi:MAG: hypothetical protein KatS3mg035_0776 [Bacteroidia bacterium]|nr:MAG: hypothetical protein KatS3mg035_0776 [Bacteroidia bacterium]